MATIPPIDMGALKVTFPANLPRNEKDLICMLLAGRLKDLWKGKLICAQLAIDDLIKSTTGVSALSSLREGLVKLRGSLDQFKQASGYDKILGGVNKALGQVSNVFSLGGLCPSPVQAPKIPDILATLNQNLFGQAGNILNALAQASNPKVCLGGGPKGFGLDWSKVTGDLKLLKNAIDQFKRDPAGFNSTMKAFESNVKSQAKRMNSELKRLEKNLTDPLGINEKRNTVSNVKRVKAISDDFPVKDKNGILYKNPSRIAIPGEIDYVISRTDPVFTDPIKYRTYPVYDYCGNIVGYERRVVTGDENYLGFDTVFTQLNVNTPTINPTSTFAQYDYTLAEETGSLVVYNTAGEKVNEIKLTRGIHYRIGLKVNSFSVGVYDSSNNIWSTGITLTKEPDSGLEFEVLSASGQMSSTGVEVDWAVSIENPTTPDNLFVKTNTGEQVNVIIDGPTSIPDEDKTYDISMLLKKSWLNVKHASETVNGSTSSVKYETRATDRQYSMTTKIVKESGEVIEKTSTLKYGAGIKVSSDTETFENGDLVEGGKIVTITQDLENGQYFVIKKFINDDSGFELNQLTFYLTNGLPSDPVEPQTYEQLAAIRFEDPIVALNDIKLPYKDYSNYKFSSGTTGKLNDMEENSVEKIIVNDKTYLAFHLSSNRYANVNSMPANNFLYSSYIEIDPTDPVRTYLDRDPKENRCRIHIKGQNGFLIDCVIDYTNETTPADITAQVKSSPTGAYLSAGSESIPTYTFRKNQYVEPFRPVKINGALPPYTFKIKPDLPPGMIFDVDTCTIRGTPTDFTDRTRYDITFDSDDLLTYSVQFYVTVANTATAPVTMSEVNATIAATTLASYSQTTSTSTAPSVFTIGGGYNPGGWVPAADSVAGRDHYYSSLFTAQPSFRDLRSETPVKVTRQPLETGNGVVYDWLIEGKSFQTGILYNNELIRPRQWAFSQLPLEQRKDMITEYANTFSPPIEFFITPGGDVPSNLDSSYFSNFLIGKGIGPASGTTFTSTNGDVYTWNGSAWDLTTPWTRG